MRKIYGESRVEECPFCDKKAVVVNSQGIPVCGEHKAQYLNLKCICGETLDVKSGKYGVYFECLTCGNISYRKALSFNPKPVAVIKDDSVSASKDGKMHKRYMSSRKPKVVKKRRRSRRRRKRSVKIIPVEKRRVKVLTKDEFDLYYK
ncbi:hypothetical protein KY330_02410 [Candidatus Woesearchaeota archaeon]|nr:hypothetical protein [Candidatus Woesearchaeota archaeon]